MIYQVVVALAVAASASAVVYTSDVTAQKYMWETFKREHHRSYDSMEEDTQRFSHFLENLKIADMRNENERKAGGTAIHGITKFFDLSQSEFKKRFLTADVSMKSANRKNVVTNFEAPKLTSTLVDWTTTYTTPVKDQVRTKIDFPFCLHKFTIIKNFPFHLCTGLLRWLLGLLCHRAGGVRRHASAGH